MRKKLIFLLMLMFLSICFYNTSLAETLVSGNVSGTWTSSNSPYIVTNNLVLQPSDTLIIDPGVAIKFDGNYRFDIFGTLFSVGTEPNPIEFTKNGSTNWMSINFADASNDNSKLEYCIIENGSESGYSPYRGVINCNESSPTIANNLIHNNSNHGVYIYGSSAGPLVKENVFNNNNSHCVYVLSSSQTVEINGNTFTSNNSNVIYLYNSNYTIIDSNVISNNSNDGIYLDDCENITIDNNTISGNSDYGIFIDDNNDYLDIKNNAIFGNTDNGIYIDNYNQNTNIENNNIYDNGNCGIYFDYRNYNINIKNNTIYDHDSKGIYFYDNNYGNIIQNLIYDNYSFGIYLREIYEGDCEVRNNTINGHSDYGLYWDSYDSNDYTLDARNNSITNNGYGIYCSDGGDYNTLAYNNCWNNANDNYSGNLPSGAGNLTNVNPNGTVCDIYYNISENPMYTDLSNDDFHLQVNSPNIDAGDPSITDPDATPSDIGVFPFLQNVPIIDVSTTELDFGQTIINQIDTLDFTITNIGNDTLFISPIQNNLSEFSFNITSSITLQADSSITIGIMFEPTSEIQYSDVLTITSNSASNSTLSINLSGSGIIPYGELDLSPSSIDFGIIDVNDSSSESFTISSVGLMDVTIDSIISTNSVFSTSDTSLVLSSGESIEKNIVFEPNESMIYQAQIIIYSNAQYSDTLNLSGVGYISYGGPNYYVSENGNDLYNGSPGSPFATLTHAIDVATDGDTIRLMSGTYFEYDITIEEEINIIGQDMNNTIINADNNGRLLEYDLNSTDTLLIKNIQLTNGYIHSDRGLAIYVSNSETNLRVSRCYFYNNHTSSSNNNNSLGGAIYSSGLLSVDYSIFKDNYADESGGAIFTDNYGSSIVNCTFYGNECDDYYGGAVYCNEYTSLFNNIFSDNSSYDYGGSGNHISGNFLANYNDFNDPNSSPGGTGNLEQDPEFVDFIDFELDISSPCIDAGDPNFLFDPDGTPKDMGAKYFHQFTDKIEIDSFSANNIYSTEEIQIAMSVLTNRETFISGLSDSIDVYSVNELGTFTEVVEENNQYLTSFIPNTVGTDTIICHYSGAEIQPSDSLNISIVEHYTNDTCYVDQKAGSDFWGNGGRNNPFASLLRAIRAIEDKHTIAFSNGSYNAYSSQFDKSFDMVGIEDVDSTVIDFDGSWEYELADPFLINFSCLKLLDFYISSSTDDSLNIINSIMKNEVLISEMNTNLNNVEITDVHEFNITYSEIIAKKLNFHNNYSDFVLENSDYVYIDSSSFMQNYEKGLCINSCNNVFIFNSVFIDNSDGGIELYQVNNANLSNNYGELNTASDGGFAYINYSQNVCIDSLIAFNNFSYGDGGALYIRESEVNINKSNIIYNSCEKDGGGIYLSNSTTFPQFENSIFWGNTAGDSLNQIYRSTGLLNISYCDIQDGYAGQCNINSSPLFVSIENKDFSLTGQSPCINSGNPESNLDPDSTRTDIGRYYYPMDDIIDEFKITSIVDAPNDNGGNVIISWKRTIYDGLLQLYDITDYSVWRWNKTKYLINGLDISRSLDSDYYPKTLSGKDSEMDKDNLKSGWEYIGSSPAQEFEDYSYIAPTLQDSSLSGIKWSIFAVVAHTPDPDIYFITSPDSGYSIDNLAPEVPQSLSISNDTLYWNKSPNEDFKYFNIYYSKESCNFQEPLLSTVDSLYNITEQGYYAVTSIDDDGNESEFSQEIKTDGVHSLLKNFPNPFLKETTFSFYLNEPGNIKFFIYNIKGRLVDHLGKEYDKSGHHSINWDSKGLSSGIYFYSMEINGANKGIKKMIIMK